MASNNSTIVDGDGFDSDWIEIYNPGDETIDLAGWHLTDNAENLDKWTFPSAEQSLLQPGEYLIVFASGKDVEDYVDPGGYLHTDFSLGAEGEYLAIVDPALSVVHDYAPAFPQQIADVSYGLLQNTSLVPLVGPSTSSTMFVPTNGSLDAPSPSVAPAWTLPSYDDAGWLASAGPGVGFDSGGDDGPNDVPNGTLLPGGPIGFDLTDPEEDGILNGTINSGGGSPGNEESPMALDGEIGTKWLAFEPFGTYFEFEFDGGVRHAVNGYTITSANDASDRDPYSWTLSGSNDGFNYTVVDTRTAQDFDDRFETRLYELSNNASYSSYRFDFQTEFGATGNNQPNSIQMAEIELLSTGPIDFSGLIDLDIESQYEAAKTSAYQRIEFEVDDPSSFAALALQMKYDDGFVAYLNGKRVASAAAPSSVGYDSNATSEREDSDSLTAVSFNLTEFINELVPGTNVLAIHALNVDDASPDMLVRAELTATELVDDTIIEAYMPVPTPGLPNTLEGVSLGPIVRNVTENIPRPSSSDSIIVTAEVNQAGAPIEEVTLHYRVMFGSEVPVVMNDDGVSGDAVAGDGVYAGVIPSSAYSGGEMVRWYVTAEDSVNAESRYPLFVKPDNSPEYFGTVIAQPGVSTDLPVFEYFVENTNAASTEAGTRASVYFRDEFYDNVFIRRRGGNTTQGRKFEFNDGHHFLFDPAYGRVDEINLNERGAEPTYMRQVLSWDVYAAAGVPASIGQAWYTRRNDSFLDVRIFVEQPDSDLLVRTGLDPDGALYKIGKDGRENSVTSSTNGVQKRTRKFEDNSDLQALVDGVSPNNPDRVQYVFDNIDIAASINYIAATSIIHDNDHPHKNYHLYRDTEGSGQWTFLPWDKDLTFGLNFGLSGIVADQDPFSHPFFGDEEHQKVDGQWNRMIDALFEIPEVKEMYVRRLRTLMDELLLPPNSGDASWIENRIDELTADLQPIVGSSGWLNSVNDIVDEYLVERREHLYVDHSINNPSYPDSAGIPNAQVGNPLIQFGAIEGDPASGDQDEEYIELRNLNATAVDISNWRIEGGIEFTFRPGTVIPAGGSLYISPNVPAFLARATGPSGGQDLFVQGNYSGNISRFGETLQLIAADDEVVAEVMTEGDPAPQAGQIVMSEVQYHPADPAPGGTATHLTLEYVELHNPSGGQIDLSNWRLRGGVDIDFAPGTTLDALNTLLVVPFDPTVDTALLQEFRSYYGIDSSVRLIGPYDGQLSNGGEDVRLLAPTETSPGGGEVEYLLVDSINYLDESPWPVEADGGGASLTRIAIAMPGTEATSWEAAAPTPGRVSFELTIAGDFNSDRELTTADLDLLVGAVVSGSAIHYYDLNGDAIVDRDDIVFFVDDLVAPINGDFNFDGVVDASDHAEWKSRFGSNLYVNADGNGNGWVDAADYTVWRDNLGATAPVAVALAQSEQPAQLPSNVVTAPTALAATSERAQLDIASEGPAYLAAFARSPVMGAGERSAVAPKSTQPWEETILGGHRELLAGVARHKLQQHGGDAHEKFFALRSHMSERRDQNQVTLGEDDPAEVCEAIDRAFAGLL